MPYLSDSAKLFYHITIFITDIAPQTTQLKKNMIMQIFCHLKVVGLKELR